MLLWVSPGDVHPLVLAMLLLAVGFGMKRSVLSRTRRRFDPIGDARQDLADRARTSRSELRQHEVRLHEVAREAEATLQSKIAVLDRMVSEADQDIARLEELLTEIRDIPSPRLNHEFVDPRDQSSDNAFASQDGGNRLTTQPTVESDQFIRLLRQTGFNAREIANVMHMPEAEVRRILGEAASDEDDDRLSNAA